MQHNEVRDTVDYNAIYTGGWVKNSFTRQGRGRLERTNGEKYDGFFVDSKFNGKGIFTFAKDDENERETYQGVFKDGKFHNYGLMTYKNKDSISIRWENNEMVG